MTNVEPFYPRAALYARWSVLAFVLFLVGTNAFLIAGVLPEMAHDFDVSISDVAFTITLYAIVIAIAAPAVSMLLPRWSRTKLMVTGLAIVAGGTAIATLAPDLTVFGIGRVVAALGGAALVPTATAAGAAIAPPARRGQAIAFVGVGFTLATAVGAPIGAALAAVATWRLPMLAVAILAVLGLPLLGLVVRKVPIGAAIGLRARFTVLRDHRILLPLLTTALLVAGFQLAYVFGAAVTGFSGAALAALLLVYGIFSVVGNMLAGPLTDRFGSRRMGAIFFTGEIAVLIALVLLRGDFAALAAVYVVWGLTAFAGAIPIQHRLVAADPAVASVAISWYSTAMYVGVAFAPLLGGVLISAGLPSLLPLAGAVATAIALVAFLIGFVARHRAADRASDASSVENVAAASLGA
jgi:predicted MFS family arabinose efflux permease